MWPFRTKKEDTYTSIQKSQMEYIVEYLFEDGSIYIDKVAYTLPLGYLLGEDTTYIDEDGWIRKRRVVGYRVVSSREVANADDN